MEPARDGYFDRMRIRSLRPLALLLLGPSLGCASILTGTHQSLRVATSPADARVLVDGREVEVTDGKIALRRGASYHVRVEREGYVPAELDLHAVMNPVLFVDLLFGPAFAIAGAIDGIQGAHTKLDRDAIEVSLSPLLAAETSAVSAARPVEPEGRTVPEEPPLLAALDRPPGDSVEHRRVDPLDRPPGLRQRAEDRFAELELLEQRLNPSSDRVPELKTPLELLPADGMVLEPEVASPPPTLERRWREEPKPTARGSAPNRPQLEGALRPKPAADPKGPALEPPPSEWGARAPLPDVQGPANGGVNPPAGTDASLNGIRGKAETSGRGPGRLVVAVMDVRRMPGAVTDVVADALTDQMRVFLAQRRIQVVDRGAQEAALRQLVVEEKARSYSSCVDSSCQIPLGKALAASHILRWGMAKFGSTCTTNGELVDLISETTVAAGSARSDCSDERLLDSTERLAEELLGRR